MVIYYAHEGMTTTVLLVAFNVLAKEKINISALLKCFAIRTSREQQADKIKENRCGRFMLTKNNTVFIS